MSVVFEITTPQQLNELLSNYNNVIIDIYAEWCQPCKYIGPKLEELAKIHSSDKTIFCKCDIETKIFQAQGLPTIYFFQGGDLIHTTVGANLEEINAKITELCGKASAVGGVVNGGSNIRQSNMFGGESGGGSGGVASNANVNNRTISMTGRGGGGNYKSWKDM
jgi:thioredoxin-like negative regulator of GroEL